MGFNNSFPLFSLVLIKENEDPLDIGTLSLYFDYKKNEGKIEKKQSFKFNSDFEEKIYVLLVQKI